MGGTPTQTRSKRVLEQPNEPPLSEGHTSGSEEGRMKHTFELTDTVPPTPHDSPLTGGYTLGSNEAFITPTKRVKKLETQLKQKRSRAVIYSSDEEEPSLDIKDSPKQGRMIGEIDKDENINLVSEQVEVHEIAEPLKDADDATLAETLLNIKRSTTKDKGKDQREEDVDKVDQTQDIVWNDLEVLRYHAFQNRVFSKSEGKKNMCTYLKNQGAYKQSYFKGMKYEDIRPIFERVEEMKLYMKIVPAKEIAIVAIPIATKPPVIVEYKIVKEGKISNGYVISGQKQSKTDKTRHGNEKISRNQSRRRIHLKSNPVNPLTHKNPKTISPLVLNHYTVSPKQSHLHVGNPNAYDWLKCMAHDLRDDIDRYEAVWIEGTGLKARTLLEDLK
nr:hypothetical protein [Tanacetum cinerariifolium]